MKLTLLVKDVTIKTLVSGDKSGRIILETLMPSDCENLAILSRFREVEVDFKDENKEIAKEG